MFDFLVGRCGKTAKEALLTTMPEYKALFEAKEAALKEAWELARWEQFIQVQISGDIKPNSKPTTPQAFFRFPWEAPEEPRKPLGRITEEQAEQLNKIFSNGQDR